MPAYGGAVRLSYLLTALVLARPGLRALFLGPDGFDGSACLRWLVLHGVGEMDLWPYLSEGFVRGLRAPTLLVEGRRLSPLQAIVMAERPDVLAAFRREPDARQFAAFFADWLLGRGVADYGHAWLLTRRRGCPQPCHDPSGTWTGALPPEAAGEDAAAFADGPVDPPSAASQARAAGRPRYRLYGPDYPCGFLDMAEPEAALSAVTAGECRPALRGGLDLLSPFIELRLPDGRDATALIRLDLGVPEPLRPLLSLRLRVRDGLDALRFERHLPAAALAAGPLVIPVVLHGLSPRLELAFALGGRPPAPGADIATTFAVLRNLCVWQVIAKAEGDAAQPAEAA